jgi:predicted kinase
VGKELNIPVFAKDWLEASLWRSGITREANSGWASYDLLSALAESQLKLGQSAILDSVASVEGIRQTWCALATQYQAAFRAIECVCSDESTHRSRLDGRQRNIPGWHELEWADVLQVRERYEPWTMDRLIVDAADPFEKNLSRVLDYLHE